MVDVPRLESILREAGELAMAHWPGAGAEPQVWEKSRNNPVCSGDLAVDAFLKRELGALLPEAGWLSEETLDIPEHRSGELVWVVDPIDGTRDFIRGRRGWAVSVALVQAGRPVLAMLNAPAWQEFWQAGQGQGAFVNCERLATSAKSELSGSRMPCVSLPPEDEGFIRIEQPNSIALRMAMVAAGRADLLATLRWGYEWDIAAAALIASEAGAAVSDVLGQELAFNKADPRAFGLMVCPPALHQAAVAHYAERASRLI
ncbi:3'(2'),5'-bisphosphate nucleotidase CysQ [Novosphingobium umbonatum]|uniref:3'(2'),5'-bisphosphate nucleotidase CysQ n=1 Tax=Novosphingobium umbonatum TaxID=1908524 RepID=A0A437N5E9_9SPHN|nr:3'(2'),5'-bisphosphate nucleotidase CysQ [Novosphingobium umbonatum]RVU05146.1 3'(2'),5'-bisphosphate nucleotidase CysQ [Novosphingobium umbonatum]